MINKKDINEEFWNTLDGWLSEGADKGVLSELFLGVGTQIQQDLKGKKTGKEVALEYVEAISNL
tara:strand:+ start:557 stop:748 length:192 start_codon:yes stop_codon:yes gene_type:complete